MAKLYDVSVTTGTYEINGEKKYRSVKVGSIWEGKNGPYLRIDRTFNPAGVPVNDPAIDSIICNMWAPKDGQQSAAQPQQAKNFSQQPAQPASAKDSDFDDSIPF